MDTIEYSAILIPLFHFKLWPPANFTIQTSLSSRLRKTDNNRLARACGAIIVNRTEELKESDVGTGAGKFEIKKIGDEYFTFVTECKNPKVLDIFRCYS